MTTGTRISPLLTDLYELTMAAGYWEEGKNELATFSLFLRQQTNRGYYVAAGLEPTIALLDQFRFTADDIAYLKELGLFKPEFLTYLENLRFQGDVRALAEGTLFFPDEPVLEVTAPLIQAQLLETCLINIVGVHTLITTKAARCVHAAKGRQLIDFGLRRTQGMDAGMAAARSTYLAGFDATSNVLAGKRMGIPLAGTMAHSFVQSFADETEAFEAYARIFPENTVLLIDTYDTLAGAGKAVQVARQMALSGKRLVGVRLDSGDTASLSRQVRRLFDNAGLPDVKIFASGGFDEFKVSDALAQDASIDAFGVGTHVGVSADQPFLDLVYKLVRYEGRDVCKYSVGKKTVAAPKQVFRFKDKAGFFLEDIVGYKGEEVTGAEKLLHPVMKDGKICRKLPSLEEIRRHFRSQYAHLPDAYKQLQAPPTYPVKLSDGLKARQPS
ncbi:MAG: nicotinate phosphoribosyltransferase [Desulfobacteraceae bacterium]